MADPADIQVTPPVKKKKDKVRSAWISFIGRIIAQIVGAVASVALAIMFLQRSQNTETPKPDPSTVTHPRRPARADGRTSLAVLPLSNYSGDSQQDYFADGMTEALIADLAQIEGLRVISRTSAMRYRDQKKTIPEIAQELDVDMVVEGSVQRSGDRVRVTAQLIDAEGDHHLWAKSYDHRLRDVLTLQGQVASEIAREIKGTLSARQQGRLATRRAVDPAVYDLYLRGRHAWSLRTQAGFEAAVKAFEQAIANDPEFALAYAGLADAYVLPTNQMPGGAAASREKALAAATRALELDGNLAEAHTSRAALHFFHERDFEAAEQEFTRAIALNPGYPLARQWFAVLLAETGRDAQALIHAREAVTLDPMSGTTRQTLGRVHYYGRRYTEAIAELRRSLELSPQLVVARVTLSKALLQTQAYAEAAAVASAAPLPRSADFDVVLGLAYLKMGDVAKAAAIRKDLQSRRVPPALALAQWSAFLGERDTALAYLQGAGPRAVPAPVRLDPMFDLVRSDPRCAQMTDPTTK